MASLAAVMPSRAARSLISGAPMRSRRAEVAVEHERLGRLHLHDQLGQLALHERMVGQLGAERLAGVGVAEGLDQGPPGAPEAHHGDAEPGTVGQLHHPGQAPAVAALRRASPPAGLGPAPAGTPRRRRTRPRPTPPPWCRACPSAGGCARRCGARRAARAARGTGRCPGCRRRRPPVLASTTNAEPLALEANHLNPLTRHASPSGVGGGLQRRRGRSRPCARSASAPPRRRTRRRRRSPAPAPGPRAGRTPRPGAPPCRRRSRGRTSSRSRPGRAGSSTPPPAAPGRRRPRGRRPGRRPS